ncbi:protein PLASTID REDOX INSENSITIVE 2, chloroplastic-like [Mangifera indica]|uniref:protein PLASTID REDOX INSENSITIVE 2, chloroplastic-like n=1 Tax=Mangifera indica TaxID=29780 RepID=UPI001CF9A3D5|nr:protein PLASTID REDOX INSENSITIVE 2, chloroplastic-like [Mangifera indica]
MATWSRALLSSALNPSSLFHSSHSSFSLGGIKLTAPFTCPSTLISKTQPSSFPLSFSFSFQKHICRYAEYKFPDPIPEFADAETDKFNTHLLNKLAKKEIFGDSLEEVVGICTEIFSTFLHTEYGGPGTLLVIPFIDMADTINERGLPGGPQAARAAVKWATDHVDKDWKEWIGDSK